MTIFSCCGYDDEMFSPEAHARRHFLKGAVALAGAGVLGASGVAPGAAQAQMVPGAAGLAPALGGGAPVQMAQAPAAPVREISQIGGNLYRFRNNFHFSVFAVTPQGVIATDPIDADAAGWLKAQITQRFNQPVKYVVYSHDHRDHIAGGQVFADTATFVGHHRTREKIIGERRPTPPPTLTFSDGMNLHLGDTTVELSYVGRNHSDNSVVMRFPAQRALFAVDFIPVQSMAFRDHPDGYLEEWLESLKRVETMDFDILAPGHGPMGTKAHVTEFRVYLETMMNDVLAGIRAGRTVDELKQSMRMERYANWGGYAQMRELNIEGTFRYYTIFRRSN